MTPPDPLRIGVLSAARIAPKAVIEPARRHGGAVVTRVAARDPARAESFAAEWAIPAVARDYQALCEADDVDVVYVATPAALHHRWTLAALAAGKDVLCEKPLAANANQAAEMVAAAAQAGRRLIEAYHWRYHAVAGRIAELTAGLGRLQRVEGVFALPDMADGDIRWDLSLGGGSLMDLGCYPVQWVRFVTGEEPTVVAAEATVGPPGVDAAMVAELVFPSGATGQIRSSMRGGSEREIGLTVTGERGRLEVLNPLAPQQGNQLVLGRHRETVPAEPSSYDAQLAAVVTALRAGTPVPTEGADSVATMAVIDACYLAAGLELRR